MQINPDIFRAYDIRGIADISGDGADLTPDTIYGIGQAVGTYMQRKYGKRLVCGKDNRVTSDVLFESFVSGLLSTGCSVISIGQATSPMIYYATCILDVDGGINITASHNPKEYNGIKIVAKNAHSVCGEELKEILKLVQEEDFVAGKGEMVSTDVFPKYVEEIAAKLSVSARPLKVVVDAGNGITGIFAPKLLRALGCTVVELHCELDGTFPNHEANPESEKNMVDLRERVLAEGADLGIGFDGDGDRVGIIDEKGVFRMADFLLIPIARDVLSRVPGGRIIFDIKSSRVLEDDIAQHGGVPIRYKTGHSFIETKMRESDAQLAGETSGHIFFKEGWYGFDDGMYAAARIVELTSRSGKPFSSFFANVPTVLTTPEIKIPCPDREKFAVVEDVKAFFVKRYPCLTIDGVWVDFGKGAWGAVRASNTTPCLTARFEARDEASLKLIQAIFFDKLKEYPSVDISKVPRNG